MSFEFLLLVIIVQRLVCYGTFLENGLIAESFILQHPPLSITIYFEVLTLQAGFRYFSCYKVLILTEFESPLLNLERWVFKGISDSPLLSQDLSFYHFCRNEIFIAKPSANDYRIKALRRKIRPPVCHQISFLHLCVYGTHFTLSWVRELEHSSTFQFSSQKMSSKSIFCQKTYS